MTVFFVDTSAIAKRYLSEVGSDWVRSWIESAIGNIIVISDLTSVEMFSLFARRQHEAAISSGDLMVAQSTCLFHIDKEYLSVALDSTVLVQARNLMGKYPLRALDAVQLACALRATAILEVSITFVSSDVKLLAEATGEGFSIDNPLHYP